MSSWSARRQVAYTVIFLSLLLCFVFIFYLLRFHKKSSCTDGIKNGDEAGIDCGGSCLRLCAFQIPKPSIVWVRPFEIAKGVYSVGAYLKNQTVGYEANALYTAKLYDPEGLLVSQYRGTVFIASQNSSIIFISGLSVGQRNVARASLQFDDSINWVKSDTKLPTVSVDTWSVENAEVSPILTVSAINNSQQTINSLNATLVVYDVENNPIAISQTVIDTMLKNETRNFIFTWPQPFKKTASKIELISLPMVSL